LKLASFVNAVTFLRDGRIVAVSAGGEVVQIGAGAQKSEVIVALKGYQRGQRGIAFSRDGKFVAAGGPDGKVRLWEVPSGELKEVLEGHKAEIYSVAFSPDGKTLASTGQDQTVRLWPMNQPVGGAR
jgi:WD40 repeat protein